MTDAKVLFRDGVNAIRNEKDLSQGRKLLTESLRLDPNNDAAWLWLSKTVNDTQKKLQCIERALAINPDNQQALDMQRKLEGADSYDVVKAMSNEVKIKPSTATNDVTPSVEISQLGKIMGRVGVNWGAQIVKLIWLSLTLGFAYVCYCIGFTTIGSTNATRVGFGIAIVGILGIGVYLLGSFVFSFGQHIEVYEKGIAHVDGSKIKAFRWSDFSQVKYQDQTIVYRSGLIPIAKMTFYYVRLMDNGKQLITVTKNYSRFRDIGSLALNKVVPLILEQHDKAIKQGETLQYGKIKADRDGLQEGRKSIRWDEIEESKATQNTLIVKTEDRKRPYYFKIENVINGMVLAALVDRKMGNSASNTSSFGGSFFEANS